MKKLIFVIKSSEFGGSQSHLLQLIKHFRNQYRVGLCVGDDGHLAEQVRNLGGDVYVLPSLAKNAGIRSFFRALADVRRLLNVQRPDLVHVHSQFSSIVLRVACRLDSLKCLYTAHGWGFVPGVPLRRRVIAWVMEFLGGRLDCPVIVVSDYDRRMAERYWVGRSSQMMVVHNGISDLPAISRPEAWPNAKPMRVIMVARFAYQKNQAELIHALAEWPQDAPPIKVSFVGDGEQRVACERLAHRLGVVSMVEFLGDRDDVAALLLEADVFVLTSRFEGLPISIIEAMRASLPCVVSAVGGNQELVIDGITGFLIPQGDKKLLANRLAELAHSATLKMALGSEARRRFECEFRESHMFKETAKIYLRTMN